MENLFLLLPVFICVIPIIFCQDVKDGDISLTIFGGNDAEPGKFPFIGSLQTKTHDSPGGTHACGAILINKTWALTAAHCICPSLFISKVVFGDINLKEVSPSHRESTVLVVPHEYFKETTGENDIALVFIRDAVEHFNQNVSQVSLTTSSDEISVFEKCYVAGWGYTSEAAIISDALQYAEVKLVEPSVCEETYGNFNQDVMICAQSPTADACVGDSGGPLVCSQKDSLTLELVGIVSYGVNVCMAGDPGVYTRVSAFQTWIAENKCTKPLLSIPLLPLVVTFGYHLLEHHYITLS